MSVPADTQQQNILEKPLTVGDWILTLIVLSIPIVGFIFLLYWGLSSTSNVNRKNYCLALLVISLIFIALIAMLMFLGVFAGIMKEIGQPA